MSFNLLAIRKPDDGNDAGLYPLLMDRGNSWQLTQGDGNNRPQYVVTGVGVWEVTGNKEEKLCYYSGDNKVRYTVTLTDSRVVVHCPDFHHGDVSDLAWDMPGMFLLSTARAKARTLNKAVIGHLPYRYLQMVALKSASSGRAIHHLRLYLFEATGLRRRQLFIQFTMVPGKVIAEPTELAAAITKRHAAWWSKQAITTPDTRRQLEEIQRTAAFTISPTKWVTRRTIIVEDWKRGG